jgi:hypothetical protein
MPSSLDTLRKHTPQSLPLQFLRHHPGSWIQYYDDTPRKDSAKAASSPLFLPSFARKKQLQRCAVCFSLQAFRGARTKEGLLRFRNLGVDIDLAPKGERQRASVQEIEAMKDEYLRRCLLPFPLKPHWVIETRGGFHVIFRIRPVSDPAAIRSAEMVNRRLVALLHGDDRACLLTQVLRVPNTLQFKDPQHPFHCRLLLDNAETVAPYDLQLVKSVLDALDVFRGNEDRAQSYQAVQSTGHGEGPRTWQEGLRGVPVGQRNAAAASIVGGILCRLPEDLWETAGWGGLKEWNARNPLPLHERELRCVYQSIARRERTKRQREEHKAGAGIPEGILVRIEIRIQGGDTAQPHPMVSVGTVPKSACVSFPPGSHAEH